MLMLRPPLQQPTRSTSKPSSDSLCNGSPTPLSQQARMTPQLTKLLVNVTIQGTYQVIHLVMSTENTVADLVAAVVSKYIKDCRQPILPATNPSSFNLHYSQFDFESLEREKKLIELGSRNFFLCRKKADEDCSSDVTCLTYIEKAGSNKEIPRLFPRIS